MVTRLFVNIQHLLNAYSILGLFSALEKFTKEKVLVMISMIDQCCKGASLALA